MWFKHPEFINFIGVKVDFLNNSAASVCDKISVIELVSMFSNMEELNFLYYPNTCNWEADWRLPNRNFCIWKTYILRKKCKCLFVTFMLNGQWIALLKGIMRMKYIGIASYNIETNYKQSQNFFREAIALKMAKIMVN